MSTTTYTPRPDTKVARVADALSEGPMTTAQLAELLSMDASGLSALLAIPLDREFFIKVKDADGVLHYALGGTVIDKRFTVLPSFLNVKEKGKAEAAQRLADGPVVRRVTTPSVFPSPAALAAAHPFAPKAAATEPQPEQPQPVAQEQPSRAPADDLVEKTAPQTGKAFVAGLFSNGELVIAVGDQSLRLSAGHTRELFDYLDRITDMLAAPAGCISRA